MIQYKKIFMTLALLLTAATGAWAQAPAAIDLTTTDGKTWTLASMPEYNVELQVEYHPAAKVTTAPNPKLGLVYNGTDLELVTAGVAEGGEMQYSLTADGTFSATIPTAKAAGNYTVYYKVVGDAEHQDVPVSETPVNVSIGWADSYNLTSTDGKTWTLTAMPAYEAELEAVYYPTAQWATEGDKVLAPTAIEDAIYAGTTAPVVNAGTVAKTGGVVQGTVMYALTSTNEAVPALSAFSSDVPTAENVPDAGATVYVWYYIKGADAPAGVEPTVENTFSSLDICAVPLTVNVLANKYDIKLNAANANTIEAGKAAVKVGTETLAPAEGKIAGVKMNSTVVVTATEGYQIKSIAVKKTGTAETIGVIVNTTKTEASFTMPAYGVTMDYELVRNMTVGVTTEMLSRIRIKKEGDFFIPVTPAEILPTVTDKLDAESPIAMTQDTDYTLQLQKEGENNSWSDVAGLSVGNFRYKVTGTALYDGTTYTNSFVLYQGYEVVIPAGEYVTYFRDEALRVEDDEVELYSITAVEDGKAVLSNAVDAMKSNTPFLVYNNSTQQKTVLLIPCNEPDLAIDVAKEFKGTLTAQTFTDDDMEAADYYVCNGKEFIKVRGAGTLAANMAYLMVSGNTGPLSISIRRGMGGDNGGETTGIDSLTPTLSDGEGVWYDLNGRRLQGKPSQKGVYIKNGKKIVVK